MNEVLHKWRSALALKWLWLVHVYPFNWAHKPLCDRFCHDVVRIGHVHLCRSCLLAYVGILAGVVASIAAPSFLQTHGATVFAPIAATTILFSLPFWYKRWPRRLRDVLRFCMGLSIALCGCLLVSGQILVGMAGAIALAVFWRTYLTLRRRRRMQSCAGCPELGGQRICSGFQFQAECLRAYEQKATQWILANTAAGSDGWHCPGPVSDAPADGPACGRQ